MKKVFLYLILTSVLILSASMPVMAAETVSKVPWMIFTYGVPGLALLAIIIPFFLYLIGNGEK